MSGHAQPLFAADRGANHGNPLPRGLPQLSRKVALSSMTRMVETSAAASSPGRRRSSRGSRDDVARVVGLADVLVRPGLQARGSRSLTSASVESIRTAVSDRRFRRARISFSRSMPSPSGKQDVENDDSRRSLLRTIACAPRRPSAHEHGCQPRLLESLRQVHADGQAVVDDQHAPRHRGVLRRSCTRARPAPGRSRSAAARCSAAPSSTASRGMP